MVVSERVRLSRIIALVGYCVLCCLCLLLLVYLRRNRHVAFKGDAQATRKVILPAYEPLLWLLAMVTGALAVLFCIALSTDMYTSSFTSIHGEIFYAGRQFVFVVALVFLCQKSVSVPALRRAVVMSIFLASYTIPLMRIIVFFAPQNMALFYYVRTVARVLVLIFVVNVCFINRPAGRASPSSLRTYGAYVIVYHMLVAVGTLTQMYALESRMHAATMYLMLIWGSITPLVIWNLLRADTEYWRGMGQRACDLQLLSLPDSYIQLDECISSDRIHSLIEMHKDFVIDFAHLNLRQKIGVGSSATIFSGRLQPRCPVAVKVYAPYRLTEEVVAEFSHEAALCASLIHPNIVKFYGMCVCPPSICLVFELCQGSLEDISCAQAQARSQRRDTRHQLGLTGKVKDAQTLDHQQMLVNVAYMLDCARAVAYIHSFSPPFLHRDIKTANFLVDNENNVKLTDFGDSRRLPENILKPGNGNDINGNESQTSAESSGFFSPVIVASAPPPIKMTVTGTVNYMAPEMISCRTGLASYGASADVYSLAITFWDILYPGRKKYAATNPLFVFEDVLNGCRPPLDATDSANPDATIPKRIRDIITSSWHSDPSARPTMPQIVRTLECIQKELLSVFVQDRSDDFKRPETGYHEITMQLVTL